LATKLEQRNNQPDELAQIAGIMKHSEAFLSLLQHRFQGDGVYLLDEPEAALSPQRQLSVLTLINRLVYHQSQLVIATHSPILLSYPNARIYLFFDEGTSEMKYTDTECYDHQGFPQPPRANAGTVDFG
jgi:predicted ATPase